MGIEQISIFQPEQSKEEEFKSYKKIISENTTEEERQRFSINIENHLKKLFPEQEETLSYMHPEIMENNERLKEVGPNDLVTVNYIDRHGRMIEDQWIFYEYLRRIGFSGNKIKKNTPYQEYKDEMSVSEDIKSELKKTHQKRIEDRNKNAYKMDRGHKYAINKGDNIKTQEKEDPYYCQMIEKAGYINTMELSPLHDYFDAIDVLLELDSKDTEPVYLGVQRTLKKNTREKKSKINKNPIWFLPEFPERNPVLRFVLAEQVDEYFLSDGTARIDTEKATKKQGILKTLETLKEARRMVKLHKEKIKDIEEVDVRKRYETYFARYEKAINALIKKITKNENITNNTKEIAEEKNENKIVLSKNKLKNLQKKLFFKYLSDFPDEIQNLLVQNLDTHSIKGADQKKLDKSIHSWWENKFGFPYTDHSLRVNVLIREFKDDLEPTTISRKPE